jgi:hypothetical protein
MKLISAFSALLLGTASVLAEDIASPPNSKVESAFDIVRAKVQGTGGNLTFAITVTGTAGSSTPKATGTMAGSGVHAYVWPTSLDSSAAGFDPKQGILALVVTSHPDFDDTPAYDENADGDPANDGNGWHSHWVVLAKDDACPAGLKVKDVAPGAKVTMPATAPGVPLFLDSPDVRPSLNGTSVEVTVPAPKGSAGMTFDGVAAGLRVSAKMEAPLLCVTAVFKIASGDLSLPGTVDLN